jgi:hypothetical protein
MDSNATCYSTKDELLRLARSRPGATALLLGFLRDPSDTGSRSSLVILRLDPSARIRAQLHVTPEIQDLPLIMRTGTSAPWMRGYALGFPRTERVTDARLQRAKSLFLTSEAAAQEWIDLLVQLLKGVMLWDSVPWAAIHRAVQREFVDPVWARPLYRALKRCHQLASERPLPDLVAGLRADCENFLFRRMARRPTVGLSEYLDKALESLNSASPGSPDDLMRFLAALLVSLSDKRFEDRHLGRERLRSLERDGNPSNVVIQGAGDLSMNVWNVGYWRSGRHNQVVLPENEPFSSRLYNCLILWRMDASADRVRAASEYINGRGSDRRPIGVALGADMAIAPLRFSPGPPHVQLPEFGGSAIQSDVPPIRDLVEFALYGKLIAREGEVLELSHIVEEFQDLRHVYLLPNLNPQDRELDDLLSRTRTTLQEWYAAVGAALPAWVTSGAGTPGYDPVFTPAERAVSGGRYADAPVSLRDARRALADVLDGTQLFLVEHYTELAPLLKRPRHIFSEWHDNSDVWLFEYALLSEPHLRALAATAPISVEAFRLGAPRNWTEFCLLLCGYRRRRGLADLHEPGDFAWEEGGNAPRLAIRLKRSSYPCTLIGIGSGEGHGAADCLYVMAWGHAFNRDLSVFDCARTLCAMGARYVLVVDEGQDVFQFHVPGELVDELDRFRTAEAGMASVDKWMPVPIAGDGRTMRRRALRASVAFWQVARDEWSVTP